MTAYLVSYSTVFCPFGDVNLTPGEQLFFDYIKSCLDGDAALRKHSADRCDALSPDCGSDERRPPKHI